MHDIGQIDKLESKAFYSSFSSFRLRASAQCKRNRQKLLMGYIKLLPREITIVTSIKNSIHERKGKQLNGKEMRRVLTAKNAG